MSETNGHTPPRPGDERFLDLDPFAAPTRLTDSAVTVDGVAYRFRSIFSLTGQEEAALAALDRAFAEAMARAQDPTRPAPALDEIRRAAFDRAYKTIRLMVPDMPERVV